MTVELFSEPLHRRYHASRCSCAYLFTIITKTLMIILPVFLAYPGGIWLRHNTYHEQPDVHFSYKLVLVLHSSDREIFYSTSKDVNALHSKTLRMAAVRSREEDDDIDGFMDRFMLNAMVPLSPDESVYEVQAALVFNYRIQNRVKLDTDALAYIRHTSGLPFSSLDTHGTLALHQSMPLSIRDDFSILYEDEPLFENRADVLQRMLRTVAERKVFVDYVERFSSWTRSVVPSHRDTDATGNHTEKNVFNFTVHIDIPTHQEIAYIPTVSEIWITFWIQYLSLFVVVGYFLKRICSFIFFHQIVDSRMDIDSIDHCSLMYSSAKPM